MTEKSEDYLEIFDSRTGKKTKITLSNGAVDAKAFSSIVDEEGRGITVYDPGLFNTAVCSSRICHINGNEGTLRYRGYSIEELVEKSSFLEVSYLLLYGDLPSKSQLQEWDEKIMRHTFIHENLVTHMKTFRYDAHPMGMLISSLSALSTFYPEANPALSGADIYLHDKKLLNSQIYRILGKLPTIAAAAYRHRIGRPINHPVNHLDYCSNYLYMLDKLGEPNYVPDPRLAKAMDVMLILHAEHGLNASTAAVRHIASTHADPITAISAGASALFGPLHGGASESVLHMLEEIGSPDNVGDFLEQVKCKKRKLMGFGHRVYREYDPRARIIKQVAQEVFEVCGRDPLIDVAEALEAAALNDDYFRQRRLYPNLDYFSGLVYRSMGFPVDYFPVLFLQGRIAGWLSHYVEQLSPDTHIFRPKQIYGGAGPRQYVPVHQRPEHATVSLKYYSTGTSKRSSVPKQKKSFLGTSKY